MNHKGLISCILTAAAFLNVAAQDIWTDVGDATFVDGWLMPGFGFDQYYNRYEVPLQQNAAVKSRYRLVNPYKSGPLAYYNESTADGYIVFDVADPDHVVFEPTETGFSYPAFGITEFYVSNQLGMTAAQNPDLSVAEIIADPRFEIPYTTYRKGVVALNFIRKSGGELVYDANYGYQGHPTGGFGWLIDGVPADMTSLIIFPGLDSGDVIEENGVDAIEADSSEAGYYTLDGRRVMRPAPGSILIERRASSIRKILF
ncbi:MAG: hypothetical protein J1F07_03085 [Muribaculaceae bacterium]|nr:hypothetical protein [Muribaculaceae bacterium]